MGTEEITDAENKFTTSERNFTSGIAKFNIGINFARSNTKAVNPYDLNTSSLGFYVTNGEIDTSGLVRKKEMQHIICV